MAEPVPITLCDEVCERFGVGPRFAATYLEDKLVRRAAEGLVARTDVPGHALHEHVGGLRTDQGLPVHIKQVPDDRNISPGRPAEG